MLVRRSLYLVALVCAWAWAHPARAEPVVVATGGDLPFARDDLAAALAARAAADGDRVEVSVTGAGGVVEVEVAGASRAVALGGARGPEAARLVAFAILDLASDPLAPPIAVLARARDADQDASPSPPPPPAPRVTLWGRGGTRIEGELDVQVPIHGAISAIAGGGAGLATSVHKATTIGGGGGVTMRGFPIRAGLAWRGPAIGPGRIEPTLTAVAVILRATITQGLARQPSETDAVFGAGVALTYVVPLITSRLGRLGLIAGGGLDGFATVVEYRAQVTAPVPLMTTPRLAWWGGAGISGELAW